MDPMRRGAACLVCVCLGAQAPDESDLLAVLNTKVEVSSRVPTTVFRSPSTVSVMDRETLQRYGVQTLDEALDLIAGVRTVRSLGYSDIATVRGVLQDAYMNRVLLLVNGVEVWDTATGLTMPVRIALQDVERIEVLKGPASVLYGTNAYAGAINVILRRATTPEAQATGAWLSQGGHRNGAHGSVILGEDENLFVGVQDTRMHGRSYLFKDETGVLAPMEEHRYDRSAEVAVRWGGHRLLFNGYEGQATSFGIGIQRATGAGALIRNEGQLYSYGWHRVLHGGLILRTAGTLDRWFRVFPAAADNAAGNYIRGTRYLGQLALGWHPTGQTEVEIGGTTQWLDQASFERRSNQTGAFIQADLPSRASVREQSYFGNLKQGFEAWTFWAGTRYTQNSAFGHNLSSRLSAVYSLGSRHSVKVQWGEAFRAPTVFDLYVNSPKVLVGNPNLKPETSSSLELAWLYAHGPCFVQVQAFESTYRHKLLRVKANADPADRTSTVANGPTFQGRGGEIEVSYRAPNWYQWFCSLSHVAGNEGDLIPGKGSNYQMVPHWEAKGGWSVKGVMWSGALVARYREGARGPLGGELSATTTLDATLGFERFFRNFSLQVGAFLKNATDVDLQYAENARRNLDALPEGLGRQAVVRITFRY